MDIAVRDGRIVGVRGRAVDRVNRGRLDPEDLYGWQADNSPGAFPVAPRSEMYVYRLAVLVGLGRALP
jgi:hypothetical protein